MPTYKVTQEHHVHLPARNTQAYEDLKQECWDEDGQYQWAEEAGGGEKGSYESVWIREHEHTNPERVFNQEAFDNWVEERMAWYVVVQSQVGNHTDLCEVWDSDVEYYDDEDAPDYELSHPPLEGGSTCDVCGRPEREGEPEFEVLWSPDWDKPKRFCHEHNPNNRKGE